MEVEKVKQLLIAYFLTNISAENHQNPVVYVTEMLRPWGLCGLKGQIIRPRPWPHGVWPRPHALWPRHTHTHTHTSVLRLCWFCPGQPGWASTRRNIHPLTPIVVINRPLSASSRLHL